MIANPPPRRPSARAGKPAPPVTSRSAELARVLEAKLVARLDEGDPGLEFPLVAVLRARRENA